MVRYRLRHLGGSFADDHEFLQDSTTQEVTAEKVRSLNALEKTPNGIGSFDDVRKA